MMKIAISSVLLLLIAQIKANRLLQSIPIPPPPTITCANVLCTVGSKCYETSTGPVCCDPNICESGICGGIAGLQCAKGYECVADPVNPCSACPPPPGVGTCDERCGTGCTNGQMCCSHGCGHSCQDPMVIADCAGVCIDADAEPEPTTCCAPLEPPADGTRGPCWEGCTCCPDGTWSGSIGDGKTFNCGGKSCTDDGTINTCGGTVCEETCCDPDMGSFTNNPVCREGCACCPDGTWSGSIGDGKTFNCGGVSCIEDGTSTCGGIVCETGGCSSNKDCDKGFKCKNGKCKKKRRRRNP